MNQFNYENYAFKLNYLGYNINNVSNLIKLYSVRFLVIFQLGDTLLLQIVIEEKELFLEF